MHLGVSMKNIVENWSCHGQQTFNVHKCQLEFSLFSVEANIVRVLIEISFSLPLSFHPSVLQVIKVFHLNFWLFSFVGPLRSWFGFCSPLFGPTLQNLNTLSACNITFHNRPLYCFMVFVKFRADYCTQFTRDASQGFFFWSKFSKLAWQIWAVARDWYFHLNLVHPCT